MITIDSHHFWGTTMRHIEVLSLFQVFQNYLETSLVKQIERGRHETMEVDPSIPITPDRCIELIKKAESRLHPINLDRFKFSVKLWEFWNKNEFLEYQRNGYSTKSSPALIMSDVYSFEKNSGRLELVRTENNIPKSYAWINGGFRPVTRFHEANSSIISPHLRYQEVVEYEP